MPVSLKVFNLTKIKKTNLTFILCAYELQLHSFLVFNHLFVYGILTWDSNYQQSSF
ncbi:Uncharacterized protein APZ42_019343 [Daphnia magna]|uniref:Uncharacterized protein n=1 Tax=Daphnia magna TaxID=35525 RepID=A0A164YHL1_9CRUS|nr:Uncharacterized protein APZ42_019343 [Daphnia magna]